MDGGTTICCRMKCQAGEGFVRIGLKIVRFRNDDVAKNIFVVVEKIKDLI